MDTAAKRGSGYVEWEDVVIQEKSTGGSGTGRGAGGAPYFSQTNL